MHFNCLNRQGHFTLDGSNGRRTKYCTTGDHQPAASLQERGKKAQHPRNSPDIDSTIAKTTIRTSPPPARGPIDQLFPVLYPVPAATTDIPSYPFKAVCFGLSSPALASRQGLWPSGCPQGMRTAFTVLLASP